MRSFFALCFLVLFSFPAFAAEDFTLWASQTVTAPAEGFSDGTILTSADIANNSGEKAIRVVVIYDTLTPDGDTAPATYELRAVLEEEIAAGVWVPICEQFTGHKRTGQGKIRVITVSNQFIENPGTETIFADGGIVSMRQSDCDGVIPSKMRVVIRHRQLSDTGPLSSFVISAHGRKFTP